jgi:nicotinate-nucleotide--dimethylbenzimidazole phosphoribosyltransferase
MLKRISPLDEEAMEAARKRQDILTKPQGSLGRLEELSIQVAGIRGEAVLKLEHKAIVTMAADHGVAAQGVSLFPQEVTPQMVLNFLQGGAGINVLARHGGIRVVVVDMGVASGLEAHPGLVQKAMGPGTKDMAQGPAMDRATAQACLEAGIEVVEGEVGRGLDIVGTGDMGIANTASASAICAAITGEPVARVTGRGTGIGDEQLAHKVEVIERALEINKPDSRDPLDVLAKVGGFEIGGLAGVILGAAAHHIPVVIDGFISGAAALIAAGFSPLVKNYLIAAHQSVEIGHRAILDHLGLKPLLDLGLRLGEGTGAALGIFVVEASTRVLAEMATFAEAGVSEAEGSPEGASR